MYSYGSPHMAAQKQDNQHERTFSSYVRIQDVVLKTYLGRWTIGRSGERGSGISVLPAWYDDDDDDDDYYYHVSHASRLMHFSHRCSSFEIQLFLISSLYSSLSSLTVCLDSIDPLSLSLSLSLSLFHRTWKVLKITLYVNTMLINISPCWSAVALNRSSRQHPMFAQS